MEQNHTVTGIESPALKYITYSRPLAQVIGIIDISVDCKQYIKIYCKHSKFGYNNNMDDVKYHWWQNRNKEKMLNWGAPTGTVGCHCSTQNSKIRFIILLDECLLLSKSKILLACTMHL